MDIKKVAVIGAGTMGRGIAQVVSTAGVGVSLNDVNEEILSSALGTMAALLEKSEKKGKISGEDRKNILSRIHTTTKLDEAVANAGLVVEAVPELLDLKKETFKRLDKLSDGKSILATNTSQYSITEIASVVSDASRVIGMHFFHPAVVMKLIEIVRGLLTSEEVVMTLRDFSTKLGKETVVCRDSQGFISTRVLLALRLECYRLLEEGVASKEDIDKTLNFFFSQQLTEFG